MAPKLLFLYNEHLATEALLGEAFAEQGFDIEVFEVVPPQRIDDPALDVTFPDPTGYDVVVPLGARWPVYDDALCRTWVSAEMQLVRDAAEAGEVLAQELASYRDRNDLLVLGLARGGVPVGWQVARALRAPLDVFLVRKLGVPQWQELAMGALASGGGVVINDSLVRSLGIGDDAVQTAIERETDELHRREQAYRGDRPPADLVDKTVILVDDGIATGGQRAHREFLPLRDAELSNQEHVERCAQRVGDLPSDRNSTPGQAEHQQVVVIAVGRQLLRQDLAGLAAVPEHTARLSASESAPSAHCSHSRRRGHL